MKTNIEKVLGRRIWDSRGRPTVEVEVELTDGTKGRGIAPAGASAGSNEAIEIRDGGLVLGGYGVERALENVNTIIAPALIGRTVTDQEQIDALLVELDGTMNFSRLGSNASVSTSMAVLNCAAASERVPLWRYLAGDSEVRLPLPEIQIFGGGAHAGRRIDIQDLLIMPIAATTFDEALAMTAEVYRAAGQLMAEKGPLSGVADEGGWWPNFESNEEALEALTRSIERAGYRRGEVMISLDIAASEFGSNGHYCLALEGRDYDREEWLEVLTGWMNKYPILSVEDPFGEDDSEGMRAFTERFGGSIQVIGDDYLVTNAERVKQAAAELACNAVLLKPNQAGTITATYKAMQEAKKAGFGMVVSARSGETEDVTIVHLATGWNTGQLKVGSFARSERTAKWNEGLRIEGELGPKAVFAGMGALPIERKVSA
ncbi:phosphopyruvate hydratase [Caballeronia sp. 15711]|uniref:phosphopyruvate hydratase n=1 Tax=Caballeronia sp. 15711 TaxID=3391029 RepID=UPI0039E4E84C